jgi:hypothetical protein
MLPAGFEDDIIRGRRMGDAAERPFLTLLQGMQILFFSWFAAAMVLALLSVWRIKAWPLPFQVRSKALLQKMPDPGSKPAALFAISILGVLVYAAFFAGNMELPFPERRLLFVAVPMLVLVGRGFLRFHWTVVRYGLLTFLAIISIVYSIFSTGIEEAMKGTSEVVQAIREDWREGDVLVADSFVRMPAAWYLERDPTEALRVKDDSLRIWWIEFSPPEGAGNEGVPLYMARAGLPHLDEDAVMEKIGFESDRSLLFENYRVDLWPQR